MVKKPTVQERIKAAYQEGKDDGYEVGRNSERNRQEYLRQTHIPMTLGIIRDLMQRNNEMMSKAGYLIDRLHGATRK